MRQKKHDFRVMSDKKCKHPGCRKLIKQNVIDRKPMADLCYKHYLEKLKNKQRDKQ